MKLDKGVPSMLYTERPIEVKRLHGYLENPKLIAYKL